MQMQYSPRSILGVLALAASLLPLAGIAHAQADPATASVMSVDQARAAFSTAGYAVGQPHMWDWTQPPVTTFEIQDQARDRVVMVLVYPSDSAAQLGRLQAEAHEEGLASGAPHLVTGYGPSTWSGNVALVQTTPTQLQQAYRAQTDRDNGVYDEADRVQGDPNRPAMAVDLDFQQALQNGAVNF